VALDWYGGVPAEAGLAARLATIRGPSSP